ncbi:MAG: hypothetical protein BWX86_02925 [Verrucomicrobia bacterium ADurb.Bin122]|nr:MAG: hypothetical protein BWX86_02925 [Verrucomicrobia bacterium ADurb.Bin122]
MSSPMRRWSILRRLPISSFRSRTFGSMTCRLEKARSWRVSVAALSAARAISASCWASGSSGERSARASSTLPAMTVSRLLKSCATPPARRPTVSIFMACCNCSWSLTRSSSAFLRSVISRMLSTKPAMPGSCSQLVPTASIQTQCPSRLWGNRYSARCVEPGSAAAAANACRVCGTSSGWMSAKPFCPIRSDGS